MSEPSSFIEIDRLEVRADVQPRCELVDPVTVSDYRELVEDGFDFPPGVAFFDGQTYLLAAGFQRHAAYRLARRTHFPVHVRAGGLREAKLFAAGSNTKNGLRRTAADVNRAVRMVLADPEGQGWSVERIAEYCQAPRSLVEALKASTPWPNETNLWGEPHDAGRPPPPDRALEDVAKTRERVRRSARKYIRHCWRLGLDADGVVASLREVYAELEAAKPRPKPPPPEPEPERLTLEGAIPDR